ncbi:MAG: DUF3108 domain-containing protein [Rikenellaceae bacterium]|nr:DUF3108 domain-containing protein [Rikenellaceae bacterium]
MMRYIHKIAILIVFLCYTVETYSQTTENAFSSGEKLIYVVSYSIGVKADLAEVVFEVKEVKMKGSDTYHINAVAQTYTSFNWFFILRNEYSSWLRKEDLKPVYAESNIREGSYRKSANMTYDWDKKIVNTWWKNLKIGTDNYRTLNLTDDSFDGLALFFNLRNTPLEEVKDGFSGYIELVLDDKVKRLEYKFLGREEKTISKVGKFNTLKFSCQLTTSVDESFEDGSEFYLWLSDDENKIPIYLESPIRIGSVKARIKKYSNLKHPINKK